MKYNKLAYAINARPNKWNVWNRRGKFTSWDKQFHLSDISAYEIARLLSPFDYHHKKTQKFNP